MHLISEAENTSDCASPAREDPSDTRILSASQAYRRGNFYTSEILVLIIVPRDVDLLSTFHSCLISHVYSLPVRLFVNALSFNDQTLHLKVPIEITTEGSGARSETIASNNEDANLVIDGRAQSPLYHRTALLLSPPYSVL
jgi:hypothetical protein